MVSSNFERSYLYILCYPDENQKIRNASGAKVILKTMIWNWKKYFKKDRNFKNDDIELKKYFKKNQNFENDDIEFKRIFLKKNQNFKNDDIELKK